MLGRREEKRIKSVQVAVEVCESWGWSFCCERNSAGVAAERAVIVEV